MEQSTAHSGDGTSISGTEKQMQFNIQPQHHMLVTAGQSLNIEHSIPLDPPPSYAATQCSNLTIEP